MESSYFFMCIFSLNLFLCLTIFVGKSLGDSLLDSGNNDFLHTQTKSNYTPHGIDFPSGPTGRFTNGATGGDFIASRLTLSTSVFESVCGEEENQTTGINYASTGSGILPESRTATSYFKSTLRNILARFYGFRAILSYTLSRSIFVISTSSNDYLNNYLKPQLYNRSQTYPPQEFANLLLNTLEKQLTLIRANNSVCRRCKQFDEHLQQWASAMLQRLTSNLRGSTFVRADLFTLGYAQFQDPLKFVFGTCIPGQKPCNDRDNRLYYDTIHPVQIVNYRFARDCFYRNSALCTPINIHQLTFKL
ncbi:hypothetical protein MKX01_000458 [Papaver californicum]|nr:hypothetical protein MKX01_000458 [Papaver californicum]